MNRKIVILSGLFLGLLMLTLTGWGETEKEKDLKTKIESAKIIAVVKLTGIRIGVQQGNGGMEFESIKTINGIYTSTIIWKEPKSNETYPYPVDDVEYEIKYIIFVYPPITANKDRPIFMREGELEKYTEAREQEIKKVIAELLQPKIDELIKQLGAEDWPVREQAQQELIEIGQPALPSLEKALTSDDSEVRIRIKNIIEELNWGETINGLRLKISSDKQTYKLGESINIMAMLQNIGKEDIALKAYPPY